MAMVVKNNISAQRVLGELNKNTNNLAKSLKKVSSGMRINGAADDASGFSISEKMRVQIRGLDQDIRNTQTGMSLMKVAESAMSTTVNILRTLKEKALDSANDSNTDIDRQTMQKELDQYVDQVDDNANAEYNGMPLFTGEMGIHCTGVQEMIVNALYTEWVENTLDLIQQSYGISFGDDKAECKEITMRFGDNNTQGLGSGTLAAVGYVAVPGGKTNRMELLVNMDEFSTLDIHDTANVNGLNSQGTGVLDRTIAHELVHAIMASSIADFDNLPEALAEGMAELVHGIDDVRLNQGLRNAKATVAAATFTTQGTGNVANYVGGYIALRYMAKHGGGGVEPLKKFMNVLTHEGGAGTSPSWPGLDDAVSRATGGKFASWDAMTRQMQADAQASATDDDFLRDYCDINLYNDDTGAISGHDAGTIRRDLNGDDIVPEGGSTTFWYSPENMTSIINNLTIHWTTDYGGHVGDKVLQVGTKANQAIKFGFHDMRAKALGLQSENGRKVSISTQYDANNAIRLLDQALKKALNEQTTIGALQSRLEYTADNLTTASENVQKSESTIRDADMAKEMTEYTKNNILSQSAQSMLSQANQNSSSVLSLLQ